MRAHTSSRVFALRALELNRALSHKSLNPFGGGDEASSLKAPERARIAAAELIARAEH